MHNHTFSNTLQIIHQELYLPNNLFHYTPFGSFASFFFASFSCLSLFFTILANLTSSLVYQPGCSFASLIIFFAAFFEFKLFNCMCPKDYLVKTFFLLCKKNYIRCRISNTSKYKSFF